PLSLDAARALLAPALGPIPLRISDGRLSDISLRMLRQRLLRLAQESVELLAEGRADGKRLRLRQAGQVGQGSRHGGDFRQALPVAGLRQGRRELVGAAPQRLIPAGVEELPDVAE